MSLKQVRKAFGKSQREMADLLGISVRAVQSYEQNWRRTPASLGKVLYLLLYLKWRDSQRHIAPCWEIMGCDPELRAGCLASIFKAPEYCWLVTSNYWKGQKLPSWEAKLERCKECPVMRQWLPTNGGAVHFAPAVQRR